MPPNPHPEVPSMSARSRCQAFAEPGRFEICSHHSPPATYLEEARPTVHVRVPLERARYSVTRKSKTGRKVVHNLGARDVLVVPPRQRQPVTWKRAADAVSLELSEGFIAQALDVPDLQLRESFTLRDPFISAAAEQVRAALAKDGGASAPFLEAMATGIAYRIGLGAATKRRLRAAGNAVPLSAAQLARIERFVDERLEGPIHVCELAELFGLSKSHFMRRFYASHGRSPHDFVIERRLARARKLLAGSSLSITAIALRVGMSHSHFSRTFLARVGVSPREYRARQRAQ